MAVPASPYEFVDERKTFLFRRIAGIAGALTAALGVLVLLGWAADLEALRSMGSGLVTMKANTALGVVLLGAALSLQAVEDRTWTTPSARVLSAGALSIGALTLVQYPAGIDLGIDQLLFREAPGAPGTSHPGRMSMSAATALVLLAGTLLLIDRRSSRLHRAAEILGLIVLLIAGQTLIGYTFGVEALYGLPTYTAMPVHAACAFLVHSGGALLLRTERGYLSVLADAGTAGLAVRRLILVAVLLPFIFGIVAVATVELGVFSERSGLTLVVSLVIVFVLGAIGWTSRGIRDIDHQRRRLLESEREARRQAEEANRAKSEFLGVMSHELRTPLNSILSYADLLDAEIKGPLNEEQSRYVERIRVGSMHLQRMIDQLLQFTRIGGHRIEPDWEEIDAVEVVREAVAVVRHEAAEEKLSLRIEAPSGPVRTETDGGKVLEILVNFLDNALKFSDEGDVVVRVLTGRGGVAFEVEDPGPGISPEQLDEIFEPFNRLEPATTGPAGTGLGLAICREYADLLGARIEVDSEKGEGSTFRLELPERPPSMEARRSEAGPGESRPAESARPSPAD